MEQEKKISKTIKNNPNIQLKLKRYDSVVKILKTVGYSISAILIFIFLKYVFYDRHRTVVYKLYDKKTNSYIQSVEDLEYHKCVKLSKACLPLYEIDILELSVKK